MLYKNNETKQIAEPLNAIPHFFTQDLDFMSNTIKTNGHKQNNHQPVVISSFFENSVKPHFHADYQEGMDRFPNLFNFKKSEFLKFANVNESTHRIIKSYASQRISAPNGFAAGKPSTRTTF